MPAARRFDLGNYNYVGAVAVDAAMGEILGHGTPAVERYVKQLGHALAQGFLGLGLPVSGGAPGPHLAHIVTVGTMGDSHYGSNDEKFNRLYAWLGENRVKLSIRRGVLRFSLHLYNNLDDVARVLELSESFLTADERRRTQKNAAQMSN
jgi:selenocysteine lyase/cysteine desulfurase